MRFQWLARHREVQTRNHGSKQSEAQTLNKKTERTDSSEHDDKKHHKNLYKGKKGEHTLFFEHFVELDKYAICTEETRF